MKYKRATIKDIAKALNLSTSTVSRALRGSYKISAETKKQVLEYAEKINYRPNPVAFSLKERRTCAIGVVVNEIANAFFRKPLLALNPLLTTGAITLLLLKTLNRRTGKSKHQTPGSKRCGWVAGFPLQRNRRCYRTTQWFNQSSHRCNRWNIVKR